MTTTATPVGFVGLGTMGSALATNVRKAGFPLTVFDVRPEPMQRLSALGATSAGSPREVAQRAEIIEIAVGDTDQVEEVILGPDGLLSGATAGSLIAVHSTVHPFAIRRIAEQTDAKGVRLLDAQMSGGQGGATSQSLLFMVGGDEESFERCRPLLEASGKQIYHMGVLGMGAVTKVAQQIVTTVNLLAATEGFRVAKKAGVDMETFREVLSLSTGQSFVADTMMGFPSAEDARRRAPERAEDRPFYRGLRACLALAGDLDVAIPGAALAQQQIPWSLSSPDDLV